MNPIYVTWEATGCFKWPAGWSCQLNGCGGQWGEAETLSAAADAGREHLAQHHWAPVQDQVNHAIGRMGAAMNSYSPFGPCDRPDCPICATRAALQTTHNQSREGA